MGANLTHQVDDLRNLYKGIATVKLGDRVAIFMSMIMATNMDEALAKLKEYVFMEHPSFRDVKNNCEFQVIVDYVLA